jgi:LysR family transcriptional regulator for metE and metH
LKAAADELHLTLSAVSHSISKLEADLDCVLFTRTGRTLQLTEQGRWLLKETTQVIGRLDRIRKQLGEFSEQARPSLRLALGPSVATCLMGDILSELRVSRDCVALNLRTADRDTAIELLREHEVDAAIVVDPPPDDEEFTVTPLFSDELCLVISPHSDLVSLDLIAPSALRGKTLILPSASAHMIVHVLRELQRTGITFRERLEQGSLENVTQMVRHDMGVAFAPRWCEAYLNSNKVVLRPLANLNLRFTWAYLTRRTQPLGSADQTLVRLMRAAWACRQLAAVVDRA